MAKTPWRDPKDEVPASMRLVFVELAEDRYSLASCEKKSVPVWHDALIGRLEAGQVKRWRYVTAKQEKQALLDGLSNIIESLN